MYSAGGQLGIDWAASPYLAAILIAAVSYLAGNINPSILQARLAGVDIRSEGSGNPGTTNTLRVLGKKAALITLCVDILKGTLMVILAGKLCGETGAMIACASVFLGHVYPVFFGFKGGKGVATAFGALAALSPPIGFGCLAVVVLAVVITRYVSFGSIAGALSCPVLAWFFLPKFTVPAALMGAVVIWRHRTNIVRLKNKEESKLSFGKGSKEK